MHGLRLWTLGVEMYGGTLPRQVFPEKVVPKRSYTTKRTRTLRLRWPIFIGTVNEPVGVVDLEELKEDEQ